MPQINCRHFLGTKPCGFGDKCDTRCPKYDPVSVRILLVHLGALGAVVRSTSLLNSIKRKFPHSAITWVTDRPADQLLKNHPLIDRVLVTSVEGLLELAALEFDVAFVVDKSLKAAGVLKTTKADLVFGFISDSQNGVIVPATPAAEELYEIGLSNQKKFFENKKPETQLMAEALELPWVRDEYNLPLTERERHHKQSRKCLWQRDRKLVLGFNTGCSDVLAAKKWTVEFSRKLVTEIQKRLNVSIVLLGGPEDRVRNQRIAYGLDIIQSPTDLGLRDGLVSVASCDLILTGDSLGMHMAISQKIWTCAWFGPSCAHEIDFYSRGEAVLTEAKCSPCWKRTCGESLMCYDQVSVSSILESLQRGVDYVDATDRDHTDSLSRGSAFEYSIAIEKQTDLA